MEEKEPNENTLLNIFLVEQIRRLVEENVREEELGRVKMLGELRSVDFQKVNDPDFRVMISIAFEEEREIRGGMVGFEYVPLEFSSPVISLSTERRGGTMEVSTPYGKLTDCVIGKDGRLYSFGNVYFFDNTGRATKFEGVFCVQNEDEAPEDVLREWGLEESEVKKVDFIPREEDSRCVDLESEDYQMIKTILELIKDGEFEEAELL